MTAHSNLPRISALLAASLACCALEARAESMGALYEKAKLEKTLALYGAGPTGSHDRWIKDFEQRFPGVTVAFTGGLSTSLNQRIERQLASGTMEADLAILQTIQDFGKWKKADALLLFKPEGSDAIDPAYKDEDGAFTAVSVNTIVYAYNTNLVPSADVPRSALDFLKSGFQGANAIASGEKLATFDSTSTTPRLKQAGKPIEPVFSQADPTPVFLVGAAIFKHAPHPNAAKLYLTWYLAKEQQSRSGTFSPRSDVAPPPGLESLSSYNIDSGYRALVLDEARLTQLRARLRGYIGRQ